MTIRVIKNLNFTEQYLRRRGQHKDNSEIVTNENNLYKYRIDAKVKEELTMLLIRENTPALVSISIPWSTSLQAQTGTLITTRYVLMVLLTVRPHEFIHEGLKSPYAFISNK